MERFKLYSISLLMLGFVIAGIQIGTYQEAQGAVITGSTSMTVVYVREWRAGTGSTANWAETAGIYNYHVQVPHQYWSIVNGRLPFRTFPNGGAGLLWNVYDEGGSTGNRSFVAFAWDYVWPTTSSKELGPGVVSADNWMGLMLTTLCDAKNCNGKERSNLTFTTHNR